MGWVTRDGHRAADPADYADCLHKARSTEVAVWADTGLAPGASVATDLTLFSVCMDAHGYRLRGAPGRSARL